MGGRDAGGMELTYSSIDGFVPVRVLNATLPTYPEQGIKLLLQVYTQGGMDAGGGADDMGVVEATEKNRDQIPPPI